MIKKGKILTGGNISEHYPLGADNSALYSWAATFLVPETNKTGSRIDWYCNGAYYQGDPLIVPWENADEPERTAALKELDGMMDGLAKMAERLRSKPGLSADMKLFVQFIAGDPEKGTGPMALETPGKKFIYIVEGHPVLTFWGFTEKGVETAGSDPFYFLRTPKAPEPAPAPAPEPAPAPAPAPAPEPAPAPAPAPGHEPAPEPAPATETKVKRKGFWALLPAWLWWILLPLLLLLLLRTRRPFSLRSLRRRPLRRALRRRSLIRRGLTSSTACSLAQPLEQQALPRRTAGCLPEMPLRPLLMRSSR